jgi:outer membrane lipoprotein carrier protein
MKAFLSLVFSLWTVFASAQNSTQNVIDEISKASETINTLQCDFTQTKELKMLKNTMVSKGKMWCTQPNYLRWEYQTPYASSFILNNGKVLLKKGKHNNVISINRNKMLREMSRLMIPNGLGKILTEKKDFQISVETKNNQHIFTLLPQSKELRQIFTTIVLYYDREQSVVVKVEMQEKNGDNTIIELSSIKLNAAISESVYALNEK